MPTLTREQVQTRNNAFVKDLRLALQSGNPSTLKDLLTDLADKHNINFSNAQMLYYTKLKPSLEGDEKILKSDNLIETISLNKSKVRIISYNGKEYAVARDVVKTIGIHSHSTMLYEMLDERILAPVQSSHGKAQTLVITKEIAKEFLEKASKEHQSVKIREKALYSLNDFIAYLTKNKKSNEVEKTSTEPKAEHEKMMELYENEKEMPFRIYRVTASAVYGEIKNVYRTPAVMLVEDIEGASIGYLQRDFKKQDIITATVKRYDVEKNKVFLSYSLSIQEEAKEEVQIEAEENTASISISVKQKNDDTHEFTFFSQEEENEIQQQEEQMTASLPEKEGQSVLSIQTEKEYEDIISIINKEARLGALSTAAKQELIQLLNENSLVLVASNIKDVAADFQPDLGVLFVRSLAEQLKKVHL